MSTSKFTVAFQRGVIMCMLFGAVLSIFFPVPFTLIKGAQHALLYIISAISAALFICMSIYTITYKITVDGSSINVRKSLFKKFRINVADIDRIDWLVSLSGFGKMDNLTVSVGSRKFGVQTLLENSEEMIAYLKDNVDESKIWMETRGVVK